MPRITKLAARRGVGDMIVAQILYAADSDIATNISTK